MTNRQLAALETKKRLLKAGRELICEKGLAHTSIEEITEMAGVSKGTFYTYFNRKEDIVFALSRSMFGEILACAKAFAGDFPAKLQCYMVNFSAYIEQGSVRLSQEWVRSVVNPDLVEDAFDKKKLCSDLAAVGCLIESGMAEGLLSPDTPAAELSEILVDLLYGEVLCWSMSDGSYSLKERTRTFCERHLHSLLARYLVI